MDHGRCYSKAMGKGLEVQGNLIRQEREARAWTQEELSERSGLGIRTLRRLEAGIASKHSIKKVTEALSLEPRSILASPAPKTDPWELLQLDLLRVAVSPDLVPLFELLYERVSSIRRHLAKECGFLLPGVRFQDDLRLPERSYVIKVREMTRGTGVVYPDKRLVIGRAELLESIRGESANDPTYGMPGKWTSMEDLPECLEGLLSFTPVDVVSTHLTYIARTQAFRLLGVDEVEKMLQALNRPTLVEEVVPQIVSLGHLRSVLRELLEDGVSIRDLSLILELLLDQAEPGHSKEELTDIVRIGLSEWICLELGNAEREIHAIVIQGELSPQLQVRLRLEVDKLQEKGFQPVIVCSSRQRRLLRAPGVSVLSTDEVHPSFRLQPMVEISSTE